MRTRSLLGVALATALLGCATRPARPAENTVADDPRHDLSYRPDAFAGAWRITSHFVSVPSATVDTDVDLELVLRLVPTGHAGSFDFAIESITISGRSEGKSIDLRRGGPDLGSYPLSIDPHGAGSGTHPLVDTAMFLIPPTPTGAVEIGETWTAPRLVPTSNNHPPIAVDIEYRFAGIDACAAPLTGACARIATTADTGERTMEAPGGEVRYHYWLEGDSQLQLGGALTRAQMKMSIRVGTAGARFDVDGELTYQWTPAAPSQPATEDLTR